MTSQALANWRSDAVAADELLHALRRKRDQRRPAKVWASPGELAAAIETGSVQTRALDLIDDAIVWAYTTPNARLIISMPPQEGKSQRVTRIGTLWALTRDPERRVVIASYASGLADEFGQYIRDQISQHNGIEGTLDLRLRLSPKSRARGRWQLDGHRGGVYAVGVGGGLTGRAAEALVIDDPYASDDDAQSPAYRKRVWDWWQSVASTRLAPGAPVIVIMTRWHEDDLAGKLLAADDGAKWRVLNIPALADHDPAKGETDPLGREPGQWMQSARGRTEAEWEERKITVGSRVFGALFQGHPSPDAGNIWKREWWGRYTTPLWSPNLARPRLPDGSPVMHIEGIDELLQSWDMTFKDTKGSDFVVGQLWARRAADVYLIDQVRARMSFTDTVAAVRLFTQKWPQAKVKLVEDKANGTAVMDSLKKEIGGFIPIDPQGSKIARANAVAPFIEAGNVWLPHDSIRMFDVDLFLDEAAAFPNATHDDQVDGGSQALARMLLDGAGAAAWTKALRDEVTRRQTGDVSRETPELGELDTTPDPTPDPVDELSDADKLAAARQRAFADR